MLGARKLGLDRGDVDDPSPLARDHEARDGLGDEEHAVEISAHQLMPGFLRVILERSPTLDAGVVDQDVDRADLGLDAFGGFANLFAVGHVERGGVGLGALGAQILNRSLDRFLVRPLTTTRAPAPARPRASARPMPADEPVTSATDPDSPNKRLMNSLTEVSSGAPCASTLATVLPITSVFRQGAVSPT